MHRDNYAHQLIKEVFKYRTVRWNVEKGMVPKKLKIMLHKQNIIKVFSTDESFAQEPS
jgi:hypothetical protein